MLPRAELIGSSPTTAAVRGPRGGGSSQRSRPPRERKERASRGGGRDRQRGGRDRQSAAAAETAGAEAATDRPRGASASGAGPSPSRRQQPEREEAAAPRAGRRGAGRPKRRRRRRRFRKGGKSVRAGELILAAPGGQSIVYGESRQSCTALLRELAAELSGGRGPDPVALLVDPSPEELADWKREAPKAEIVSAGQDAPRRGRPRPGGPPRRGRRSGDPADRLGQPPGGGVRRRTSPRTCSTEGRAGRRRRGSLTVVAAVERAS